jgi:hypothetical protein
MQNLHFNKLLTDLTSEEYHGMKGSYSSSQLKKMLEDPEIFYKTYVTGEIGKEENAAFAVGTYFHTSVLEPHKLHEECIVYPGLARRGKEWEDFKEKHKSKAIITKTELATAEKLVASVKESPISMDLLKKSKPEVSAFIEVYVMEDEVFSFKNDECYCLTTTGWVPTSLDYEEDEIKDFGVKLVLKVRADALAIGHGIISDLKSTTGNAKKVFEMQGKVANYQYDLSAALYLDVFTMAGEEEFHTFVWIFSSKDVGNAAAYRASDRNIQVGRAKWKKSVIDLAKYISSDWQFEDQLLELGPPAYALEWLN